MDYPKSAYAYIDIRHPVVAWNAYCGVIVSAFTDSPPTGSPISMMFAGIALAEDNARLHNEFLIESIRQKFFPQCISRLSGVYFFEDKESAISAVSWGEHFRCDYFTKIYLHPKSTFSRHDANWITHMRCDDTGYMLKDEIDSLYKYWSGAPYPNVAPTWELIVNGKAAIANTDLRRMAYNNIVARNPKSVSILEFGRIAAELGFNLGNSCAFATIKNSNTITIKFYIDMRDGNNPKLHDEISNYSGPINHKDIAVGGDVFYLPDTRDYACDFVLNDYNFMQIISNIYMTEQHPSAKAIYINDKPVPRH